MQIEEILEGLAHTDRRFPREALAAAIAAKDEITPHLLKILENTLDDPEEAVSSDNWAFGYAMFLLAQFRETRAYPLVAKLAALPDPLLDGLLGDTVTEGLNRVLASVSGGDTSLIENLIENEQADDFARTAALDALLVLVATGEKSRDEVMDYYKSLFRGKLAKEPSFVWDYLIDAATNLYPEEVYEDIEQAFESELAAEGVSDLDWVKRTVANGKEATLIELRKKYHFVNNAIEELEIWEDDSEPDDEDDEDEELDTPPVDWLSLLAAKPVVESKPFDDAADEPQMPYRAPKKVGRNEPCPCGSGKKYKKCCGA